MGTGNGRLNFATGSHRGATVAGQKEGEIYPRYDLISPWALHRLATTYGDGAAKHGANNWRKGMPGSDLLNRAIGHIIARLRGDTSEDHLAHAAWGLFAVMEQETLRPECNDMWTPPVVVDAVTEPAPVPKKRRRRNGR